MKTITPPPNFGAYGEGEHYLGSVEVRVNGSGRGTLSVTYPSTGMAGTGITATATDPDGNTSEFSQNVLVGQAIVAEARRRGVGAIVLAAEEPSRVRGGAILGGRGRIRDRFVGETTRYVIEKAPCRVILTAPPAGEEGTREGVLP